MAQQMLDMLTPEQLESILASAVAPVKRGPGRPRKILSPEELFKRVAEEAAKTARKNQRLEKKELREQAPKKPVGRPKKIRTPERRDAELKAAEKKAAREIEREMKAAEKEVDEEHRALRKEARRIAAEERAFEKEAKVAVMRAKRLATYEKMLAEAEAYKQKWSL